ncbi:hypothetical protein [Streptomyces sp. NPDC059378]|uniref:hypothetical protein n=1 Tax=Streptomyces sp. NPDC059378 TaxID=3346815 RepID=UPI0036A5E358
MAIWPIAVVFYGCAAVASHFWNGQPWSDAVLLATALMAMTVITVEVRAAKERRRTGQESR